MRDLNALVFRSVNPVQSQTERITNDLFTALSFGKQEGILGQHNYYMDPINIAGTEFGGVRLFTVVNLYLTHRFLCDFPGLILLLWVYWCENWCNLIDGEVSLDEAVSKVQSDSLIIRFGATVPVATFRVAGATTKEPFILLLLNLKVFCLVGSIFCFFICDSHVHTMGKIYMARDIVFKTAKIDYTCGETFKYHGGSAHRWSFL